ncbi:GntR family transcriptional regulator [Actinoplanes sp. NPDC049265]|uniref:GntR family transcriptional regulator n=1 Tax=Actinoplanes sp. NPDC049265 TaxID=3363902 RepID=UPI003718E057
MPRTTLIPGIERVVIPEPRQAIPYVHAYLRDRILDGTLRPGSKLSQVTLSQQLGVSRTPLREVLRLLQTEGLVAVEPNQRTRVAELDPEELDEVYGSRILLEVLGITLTLDRFDAERRRTAQKQLKTMRACAKRGDIEGWIEVHADFHRTLTAGAGDTLQRQLRLHADRAARYIRIYQAAEPRTWDAAGDREHTEILDALIERRLNDVTSGLAHHLARTALHVLADCAPGFEPRAVPQAVAMVDNNEAAWRATLAAVASA